MPDKNIIKQSLYSLLLIVCLFLAHQRALDHSAEVYTEQGLNRALVTFAVSRTLNGVISVVQGTEVDVSPAGIGFTFAPGQILDPINDLIERFSWVVLASGTSLGLQRLLLEMTSSSSITWILSVLIVLILIFIWLPKELKDQYHGSAGVLSKVLLFVLFVRFSIPLVAITNEIIYLNFSAEKYQQAQVSLETSAGQLKNLSDSSTEKTIYDQSLMVDDASIFEKAQRWFTSSERLFDYDEQLDALKLEAENISQQVINMIVVFVMQTVLLPLLFLWLLIRVGKAGIAKIHF